MAGTLITCPLKSFLPSSAHTFPTSRHDHQPTSQPSSPCILCDTQNIVGNCSSKLHCWQNTTGCSTSFVVLCIYPLPQLRRKTLTMRTATINTLFRFSANTPHPHPNTLCVQNSSLIVRSLRRDDRSSSQQSFRSGDSTFFNLHPLSSCLTDWWDWTGVVGGGDIIQCRQTLWNYSLASLCVIEISS